MNEQNHSDLKPLLWEGHPNSLIEFCGELRRARGFQMIDGLRTPWAEEVEARAKRPTDVPGDLQALSTDAREEAFIVAFQALTVGIPTNVGGDQSDGSSEPSEPVTTREQAFIVAFHRLQQVDA